MEDSLEFYNNFDKKLIEDYVLGNKRIETAIVKLASFIPEKSENILDIGCGLGWSSHEFAKHFDNSDIEGIDLSPVLLETANKLFHSNNLSYKVFDITQNLPDRIYDAVVMIDVYEHIQISDRPKFHEALKSVLKEKGRLILACPSKFHQEYLKKNNPKGLQPVDEDVDSESFNRLAKDIEGELIFLEYQNIWRNLDYVYCVIERKPQYDSESAIKNSGTLVLESRKSRVERVTRKLNKEYPKPPRTTWFFPIEKVVQRGLSKCHRYIKYK